VGSWFYAKKDGKCTNCKTPVLAGDQMYAKSRGVYLCPDCGGIAQATEGMVSTGGIEEATLSDLQTFPEEARKTSMAVSMLYLARQLDGNDVSPREVTLYTKEIRLLFMQLRDLYPVTDGEDETDTAQKARERRMRESGGF
jgi:hypothetical protein